MGRYRTGCRVAGPSHRQQRSHPRLLLGTPANRAWRPGMVVGMSGIIAPDGTWLTNAGRGVGIEVAAVPLSEPRWMHNFSAGG